MQAPGRRAPAVRGADAGGNGRAHRPEGGADRRAADGTAAGARLRRRALKDFFRKTILPVAAAALLYCIFRSACVKNGELDYLWLWILCGLPFGIWRLRLWIIPGGGSLGGGIALFLLNFVFAGLIGGCVLVWRLLVAAWYVPLTLYRLLTAGCACIITED